MVARLYPLKCTLEDDLGDVHCYQTTCDLRRIEWWRGLLRVIQEVGLQKLSVTGYYTNAPQSPHFTFQARTTSPLSNVQKRISLGWLNEVDSPEIKKLNRLLNSPIPLYAEYAYQMLDKEQVVYSESKKINCKEIDTCKHLFAQFQSHYFSRQFDLCNVKFSCANLEFDLIITQPKPPEVDVEKPAVERPWLPLFFLKRLIHIVKTALQNIHPLEKIQQWRKNASHLRFSYS